MRQMKFRFLFTFCIYIYSFFAAARPAQFSDASSKILISKNNIRVKKNGQSDWTEIRKVEILKESARDSEGLFRRSYPMWSKVEVALAQTTNAGKVLKVSDDQIEIERLASQGAGFDSNQQLTIGFPKVNVGSILESEIRLKTLKTPFQDHYFLSFSFGFAEFVESADYQIESEIPLEMVVFDPEKFLSIEQKVEGSLQKISVRLLRPIFKSFLDEQNSFMPMDSTPWVRLSSMKNWEKMPEGLIQKFEKSASENLPLPLADIVKSAKAFSDPIDQINQTTAAISEQVRYMGDWKTIEGGHEPRSLSVIQKTGFGDCKDFAVLTTRILRELGYQAFPALVWRSSYYAPPPVLIPSMDFFNHAIVWAKKENRIFWVDATNPFSFAQELQMDISDRPALILKSVPVLENTPKGKPTSGHVQIDLRVGSPRLKSQKITIDGNFRQMGRAANGLTGASLVTSQATIESSIISYLLSLNRVQNYRFDPFELRSRITSDQNFKFNAEELWHPLLTTAGKAYLVASPPEIAVFQFDAQQRFSPLALGPEYTWTRQIVFDVSFWQGSPNYHCHLSSPWIDFSRDFYRKKNQIIISEKTEKKAVIIGREEIHSAKFITLQDGLRKCFQEIAVIAK